MKTIALPEQLAGLPLIVSMSGGKDCAREIRRRGRRPIYKLPASPVSGKADDR